MCPFSGSPNRPLERPGMNPRAVASAPGPAAQRLCVGPTTLGEIVKATIASTLAATAGAVLVLLLFAPLTADAQQAGKIPRIGVLWGYSPADVSRFGEAFRQGLASFGYVEGQNIVLHERWSEGKSDRLPSLAAEMIRLKQLELPNRQPRRSRLC
jgi:hypothetical protein